MSTEPSPGRRPNQSLTCPEVSIWNWNSLSKIVEQINQSKTWTSELLSPDMPAVFLCRQSNAAVGMPYECVVSEVGLIGLTETSLPAIAATPSGSLDYQVRESLHNLHGSRSTLVLD